MRLVPLLLGVGLVAACASSGETDDLGPSVGDARGVGGDPDDRGLNEGVGPSDSDGSTRDRDLGDEEERPDQGTPDAGEEPRDAVELQGETGGIDIGSTDVFVVDAGGDAGTSTRALCPAQIGHAGAGGCGAFPDERSVFLPDGWRAALVAGPGEGISAPNGIVVAGGAFGDRLLVTNAGNSSVVAIDRSTGRAETLVQSADWLPQSVQLTSIAWDTDSVLDGAAYIGSLQSRRIFRLDPSGRVTLFAELTPFNVAPPIALAIPPAGPFRAGLYVGGESSSGTSSTNLAFVRSATTVLTTGVLPRVLSATGLAFDRSPIRGGNLLVMERGLEVLEIAPNGASRVRVARRLGEFYGTSVESPPPGPLTPGLYIVPSLIPLVIANLSATGTITPVAFLGCSANINLPPGNLVAFSPDGTAAYVADRASSRVLCLERTCPRVCPPPRPPEIVSIGSPGSLHPRSGSVHWRPSLSADGRYVAFVSNAPDLVPDDQNDMSDAFVYDRTTGDTTRLSLYPDGSDVRNPVDEVALSSDGRFAVFHVYEDLLLRDISAGTSVLLSVDSRGQPFRVNRGFSITADSATVAFSTPAGLDPRDTNDLSDVYILHRPSGRISLVSAAPNGTPADSSSDEPRLSADGARVLFRSVASNLVAGDTNETEDLFVARIFPLEISRAILDSQGREVRGSRGDFDLSPDGHQVVFTTTVSLSPNDLPGTCPSLTCNPNACDNDVYVRDVDSGVVELISVNSSGTRLDSASQGGVLSFDGRYVAFVSAGNNHGYDDWTGGDVFVRDRVTHRTTRVSVDRDGLGLLGEPRFTSITPDGALIALVTPADLAHMGTDPTAQIFVVPNFSCP